VSYKSVPSGRSVEYERLSDGSGFPIAHFDDKARNVVMADKAGSITIMVMDSECRAAGRATLTITDP
jgi:hypothetical protein